MCSDLTPAVAEVAIIAGQFLGIGPECNSAGRHGVAIVPKPPPGTNPGGS